MRNAEKKSRIPFQIKTSLVITLAMCLLGFTVVLAYQRLIRIVDAASEAGQPDSRLSLVKEVQSILFDAEGDVKSWTVVHDTTYLEMYYSKASAVRTRLRLLKRKDRDLRYAPYIAPLDSLAEAKLSVLNELLNLRADDRVTTVLQQLNRSLSGNTTPPADNPSKDGAKGTDPGTAATPGVTSKGISGSIARTAQEEADKTRLMQLHEFSIYERDKVVTSQIQELVKRVEEMETALLGKQSNEVRETAKAIRVLILIFCIVMVPILLMLGYGIFDYTRKNNAHRKALQAAQEEAEKLAATREQFLADMSHEIRTPLNAINGFMDLVIQSDLSESQRSQFEIVRQSSAHLLKVVNSILDYSRLASGRMTMEHAPFDLYKAVISTAGLLRPQAGEKNLHYDLQIEPGVPVFVMGDELRLRQILLNLLGNAIKFTDTGGVRFRVALVPGAEGRIAFTISDTGIGIARDRQETIFREYEQSEESITRRFGGTGLGLAITRRLVDLLGGSISLNSDIGKGTSVRVILPMAAVAAPDESPQAPKVFPELAALKGCHVLVADDEKYNRLLLASFLVRWGMRVTEAVSGEEALEALGRHRFDIALLDIRMPGMTGVEVIRAVLPQEDSLNANTPFVAVTASDGEKEKASFMGAGFMAVLGKPFTEADLAAVLLSCREAMPAARAAECGKPKVEETNGDVKVSLASLGKFVNGDKTLMQELAATFIRSAGEAMHGIEEAVEAGDWEKAGDWAHRLAPSCIHLDAMTVYGMLRSLEKASRVSPAKVEMQRKTTLLKKALEEVVTLLHRQMKEFST